MKVRAVVFDLAGVLLDFRGVESVAELSGGRTRARAFAEFWAQSRAADGLYRGLLSPAEFAKAAVEELSLQVDPPVFLHAFAKWLRGPYPGALELVSGLRPQATVACLSNTNLIDVHRFRTELDLDQRFDHCFFSNEIRLRKPDPAVYRHVVSVLGLDPDEIAFLDDDPTCVAGAAALGLQAFECRGVDETIERVRRLGFSVGVDAV